MRLDLKYELTGIIPEELKHFIPHSFDIIGGKGAAVAIVEIPLEIEAYELQIAEALIRVHRNVRSVLSKGTERRGELRIRDMKLLIGDPNTEVTHRENGYFIRIDPAKVYFSPRECTEREKVAKFIQPNENVLVMFSGAGPFAICIAKHNPSVSVTAVELNPLGNKFCEENIKLNKPHFVESDQRSIPRMQALPPRMSGENVIRSNFMVALQGHYTRLLREESVRCPGNLFPKRSGVTLDGTAALRPHPGH